jgi:taurine dioxygenase
MRTLNPAIGCDIQNINLCKPLVKEAREGILDAFYVHVLLLFRGQDLTEDQQVCFATNFGQLGKRTVGARLQKPGESATTKPVMLVTNRSDEGPAGGVASFGDGDMWFHHDTCFYEIPNIVTMLYAIEVTSRGGLTRISNMYKAYDNIPRNLRDKLEGRTVLQVYDYNRYRIDPSVELSGARKYSQPIFVRHPVTQRKALYVNRTMTAHIEGMKKSKSDAILDELFDIAEDEGIIYDHKWNVGDLLMWDNLCSSHARTDFPNEERRILRRCTVAGTQPLHG